MKRTRIPEGRGGQRRLGFHIGIFLLLPYCGSLGDSFPSQTWLHGVAYGNGTFITVGEDGFIATSTNGLNWSTGRLGTVHLNRVAYTAPLFTVVGDTGVTYTSANNGLSWISEQTGATNDLFHAASGDSSRLVVGDYEVRVKN